VSQVYDEDEESRLAVIAEVACRHYGFTEDCTYRLINLSENATYLVTNSINGSESILRIHRANYSSPQDIASELAWMNALREQAGVRTPQVVKANDGADIIRVTADPKSSPRSCVMFEYLPGQEPSDDNLLESFELLGEIAARMHRHAESWKVPPNFTRRTWDLRSTIGDRAHWGNWRDGTGVTGATELLLGNVATSLRERLETYEHDSGRFGLVHADMRLANLLIDQGNCSVIDFDDCGYSWYLWDLATALTFIEDHPLASELVRRWLLGYEEMRPLDQHDKQHISDLVMLRRLLVLAWLGSHSNTPLAKAENEEYTHVTCVLAERYLRNPFDLISLEKV